MKFRSWNPVTETFFYFENGEYFLDEECTKVAEDFSDFFWGNNEQFIIINGEEFFEFDKVEVGVRFSSYMSVGDITEEVITGILTTGNNGICISNENGFNYLAKATITSIKKLGNTHEKE